ncbi:DUF676-domain-containing protein [Xylona heveae TC161]|uniref:DUF676-domain-containing protein n=1 Tax=Xylona heveae (strain CBS 132557 / TC161) TaxID=1328760 RepID=A0A165HKH7_XYLHT|nr:DUF676-domain-containing protein [Xylona heveae TC161]KZF23649.1 DUF676-domain-containing protein [Xylona heveae TC161]
MKFMRALVDRLSSTDRSVVLSDPSVDAAERVADDDRRQADHLCVLVHGLWGNPKHLSYLASSLREKYPPSQVHLLVVKRNAGSFTYDGIEVGGERVAQEIEDTLENLARDGQTIRKISVIGYSLGGLVARYAIGLLHSKGYFDKIEPMNFTTFATPHLGVRTPLLGFHNHLWNVLGARTLSVSGRQLFTIDSFRNTGRPLLSVLADPDSLFIHALAKFKNRSLYSNIVNDRSAVFYTTCISRIDPFSDLSAVKVNYLKGYEPVLVDPSDPVSHNDDTQLPTFYGRLAGGSHKLVKLLPTSLVLFILIPLGTILFLLNSAIQSVRSRQRIRLHEECKAGMFSSYRIPLIVEDVQNAVEEVYEDLNNTQSQKYLPAGSEEVASSVETSPYAKGMTEDKRLILIDGPPKDSDSMSVISEKTVSLDDSDSSTLLLNNKPSPRLTEFPTLALTEAQFAMIQALDNVGFKKYPVHIHKVMHSHAAIIVRMPKKGFEEGKLVAKHWLSEFEA